jgi:ABC-type multidrug transport system ATPase subunit
LPSTFTIEEKRLRVQNLISKLGLDSCKNRVIGTAFKTGISGGQRKRVSVAITLLTEPKIIFRKKKRTFFYFVFYFFFLIHFYLIVDEPTSGLDSKSAFEIIDYLKRLEIQ